MVFDVKRGRTKFLGVYNFREILLELAFRLGFRKEQFLHRIEERYDQGSKETFKARSSEVQTIRRRHLTQELTGAKGRDYSRVFCNFFSFVFDCSKTVIMMFNTTFVFLFMSMSG